MWQIITKNIFILVDKVNTKNNRHTISLNLFMNRLFIKLIVFYAIEIIVFIAAYTIELYRKLIIGLTNNNKLIELFKQVQRPIFLNLGYIPRKSNKIMYHIYVLHEATWVLIYMKTMLFKTIVFLISETVSMLNQS